MAKYVVTATWDDVPHLTTEAKDRLWSGLLPYEREARSKGIPSLGSGAIYPVAEEGIVIDPFELPRHYKRCYGLDVGWNKTACIWGAYDEESDILYLYSEHYQGKAEPSIHADAIKARGKWIPGAIDPSARGRSQIDGKSLLEIYYNLDLDLIPADNAVESGLQIIWQRLSTGRLRVFSSCLNWLGEFRIYRKDRDGKIIKAKDHLMDATRYLIMSSLPNAMVEPDDLDLAENPLYTGTGRNNTTGY